MKCNIMANPQTLDHDLSCIKAPKMDQCPTCQARLVCGLCHGLSHSLHILPSWEDLVRAPLSPCNKGIPLDDITVNLHFWLNNLSTFLLYILPDLCNCYQYINKCTICLSSWMVVVWCWHRTTNLSTVSMFPLH